MPATEFNPHAEQYASIEAKLATLRSELERIQVKIEFLENRTPESVLEELDLAETQVARAYELLGEEKSKLHCAQASREMWIEKLRMAVMISFEQREKARDNISASECRIRTAERKIALATSEIEKAQAWLENRQEDSRRDIASELAQAEALQDSLQHQVRVTEQELAALRPEYDHIRAAIEPVAREIELFEKREGDLRRTLKQAESFKSDLGSACRRDRYKAHRECEDLFGDSNPSRVAGQARHELRTVTRDLEKLRRRAEDLVRRATRSIKVLVVDGNNLCYQGGVFCGLGPLCVAVPVLSQAHAVHIVFDASIRRLLKKTDHEIATDLGDQAKVHIVASKQKADETLLDLAGATDTYVLSNDRFADFPEKEAVRAQRLIRHEIVSERVLIHELNVDVAFSSDT